MFTSNWTHDVKKWPLVQKDKLDITITDIELKALFCEYIIRPNARITRLSPGQNLTKHVGLI
jgi:hypothetical protein